jgi:hypothetical protein
MRHASSLPTTPVTPDASPPPRPQPAQSKAAASDPNFYSTAEQACHVVVTAMGRHFMYQSTRPLPCALVPNPERALGAGACFRGPSD